MCVTCSGHCLNIYTAVMLFVEFVLMFYYPFLLGLLAILFTNCCASKGTFFLFAAESVIRR